MSRRHLPQPTIHSRYPDRFIRSRKRPCDASLLCDEEWYALRIQDPSTISAFARFNRAACRLHGDRGMKQNFEGDIVLYERDVYPAYGFCILNDQGTILHIQHLYPEDDISVHNNRLRIESYPDFTTRRLASARSSSAEVVNKFSNIYRIPNLESILKRSKGTPQTIELSASTDDMSEVFMNLHSYIRSNEPFPNEFTSGFNRLSNHKPILHLASISTPPSPSTSYSASTSDSPPPFSSPPTSPSPSCLLTSNPTSPLRGTPSPHPHRPPSAQLSDHFTDPVQSSRATLNSLRHNPGNEDYHRRALLKSLLSETDSSSLIPTLRHGSPVPINPPGLKNGSVERKNSQFDRGWDLDNKDLTCPDLGGKIYKTDQYSFAQGSFSDIYRGVLKTNTDTGTSVAIKILRIPGFKTDDIGNLRAIQRRLDRESKNWNVLCHPNVLPLLGISRDFGPFPALISPYCPFRDMVQYLKHHPRVDRVPILIGFTAGLRYLHSQHVIHGDLKGQNVLIGQNGEPLICDFGLSRITDYQGFATRCSRMPPFMAPELFPDSDERLIIDEDAVENDLVHPLVNLQVTKETDIYAYGLISLQILTGKNPKFHYLGTPKTQVLPRRQWYDPKLAMSDRLWDLFKTCCDLEPKRRLTMDEVMQRIQTGGGLTLKT